MVPANFSCNCTNTSFQANTTSINTNKIYIYHYATVSIGIKLAIVVPVVVAGLYALVANSLILYFMHKKWKTNPTGQFRRSVIDYFIQSLALSDVLASLITLPVCLPELFIDYISSDIVCKVVRYISFIFPVVTCMNYLFIGIDRFISVYFPFSVRNNETAKRLVISAWITGGLITFLVVPAMVRVKFDLPNNQYTMICMYDKAVKYRGIFFLLFTACFYIIPFVILSVICIMTVRKMRQQLAEAPINEALPNSTRNARATAVRFQENYMFISLIFAFLFPYFLYVVYNGAVNIFKLDHSLTVNTMARMVSASLIYANGAIGPTIVFRSFRYLRRKIVDMFRNIIPENDVIPLNDIPVILNDS